MKSSRKLQAFYDPQKIAFQASLLAWYDTHARALPWREDRDPYRVWLSEIMLQQTRVAAVIEHYHEFLRRFPTLQKLAAAREASVLAAWSGLGYYRRARMLHAAAKVVVRKLGGNFPTTAAELLELPGVGRYTAAAMASIAFGEPVAVVDGNVERVLQRASGRRLAGEKLWDAAERLLDRNRPGDFNQALMELGATVCTARAPACLTCPVIEMCATRGEMANSAKAAPQKKREIHYALDLREGDGRGGKVFLIQRPRHASLMAGMWELPEITRPAGRTRPDIVVRHSITVTDYKVYVWRGVTPDDAPGKWMSLQQLQKVAMTGLSRKILVKSGALRPRLGMRSHLLTAAFALAAAISFCSLMSPTALAQTTAAGESQARIALVDLSPSDYPRTARLVHIGGDLVIHLAIRPDGGGGSRKP